MDFGALAHRRGRNRGKWPPIAYILFDMLAAPGEDLRTLPLEERWERLGELLEEPRPPLQRVLATRDRDEAAHWLEHLHPMGIEGIVAKLLSLPHGPRARWVKIKHTETIDVPIVTVIGHPARPEHVVVQSRSPRVRERQLQRVGGVGLPGQIPACAGTTAARTG